MQVNIAESHYSNSKPLMLEQVTMEISTELKMETVGLTKSEMDWTKSALCIDAEVKRGIECDF